MSLARSRIAFITGRLAAPALRQVIEQLAGAVGFDAVIIETKIQVAALMTPKWLLSQDESLSVLRTEPAFERVVLPGWCDGDLLPLEERYRLPFEVGPKDLFDLPEHFGKGRRSPPEWDSHAVEILAEINHAPRLSHQELHAEAERYRESGADVIDLGAIPGEEWPSVGDVVRSLRAEGFRLSIDSFDQQIVTDAIDAGAQLVLSVNQSNVEWAKELDAEWVVIPDNPRNMQSMQPTIDTLSEAGRSLRIDPILEPIGFGFAASLARYFEARRLWPELPVMMGVGNVTELTEVDSVGLNVLFAAICDELGIGSVLTTEVINWARSSVAEFDFARRLVHHANQNQVLPKHLDSRLVMLRDPRQRMLGHSALNSIASQIRDPNFRIFIEGSEIHLMNRDGHWSGSDPYAVFDEMILAVPELSASHAFYLGYELSKAVTAITLGKQYMQDQALRWGMLTIDEVSAHERRRSTSEADPRSDSSSRENP